ncbi:MAG: type 4a pilus biogenesis protein PilO [Elusimicrobiota bacterium]
MSKKMQQNLIVLGVCFIAMIFIYYSYLLSPLRKKYADEEKKLADIQLRISEMSQRALELPKLQAEMTFLQQEVEDLGKMLPKDKDVPVLLKTITKISQKYRLKVSNISPQSVVSLANYNEIPFLLTLTGTYHSLAQFLAEIGQESRILNSKNVAFSASGDTSKGAKTTISVNFTLMAYTFKG